MLTELDFSEEDFANHLLRHKIIAIITEYTIFKLDLLSDRVIFQCLKNQFTFEVLFVEMLKEIRLKPQELKRYLLDSLLTYCAIQSTQAPQILYPVCEFESFDDLLDWQTEWNKLDEAAKLKYLEEL